MPTEATPQTAPVINLESLRETYIQTCYTAIQTRLPKKLTLEDLLKRLRWHNQAMPFIHTIPVRLSAASKKRTERTKTDATHLKPSAAVSVFWHLGYVYDPDPDHGWLTTPQLVLRTRLHPTTVREIQRRYPEFIDTKRDIQGAPHGLVRRFKLILPTTLEFNSPPPLWMVDDEERRYHVTMMEETIPALDLDPRPNLLMQVLLYHSVQRRCALSYQESGLLFKNDGEMMTRVRDKLHEEKQCLSWDLPQKRGEVVTYRLCYSDGRLPLSELAIGAGVDAPRKNGLDALVLNELLPDRGKTKRQIARTLHRKQSSVYTSLRRLEKGGKATGFRDKDSRELDVAALWFKGKIDSTSLRKMAEANCKENVSEFRHSEDFRSVVLNGETFTLTTNEAQVVAMLAEAYENGTPDLSGDAILDKIGACKRLRDVFSMKRRGIFQKLIRAGARKGTYRLNL